MATQISTPRGLFIDITVPRVPAYPVPGYLRTRVPELPGLGIPKKYDHTRMRLYWKPRNCCLPG
eukprot:1101739-Rhodomonas_salina.1